MKYRHIKNVPVPLDIEKYKIYIEERDSNKNFIKEIFYDYIDEAFNINTKIKFNDAYNIAVMIFRSELNEKYEPPSYSDIKNSYIEKLFYKQFINILISVVKNMELMMLLHIFSMKENLLKKILLLNL